MMITPAQLRAARGLLDWTRSDLAKAAGLSPETIKNIEHGKFHPQEQTSQSIITAFKGHDIEFTENEGVRKVNSVIINYEGRADFKRYVDDVYNIVKQSDDKAICVLGIDDNGFVDALGDYAKTHALRMEALPNIKFRGLVSQGSQVLSFGYINYRRIANVAISTPFSVYGDRFDLILFGEGASYPKVVALKSRVAADAYLSQFNAMWNISTPIA